MLSPNFSMSSFTNSRHAPVAARALQQLYETLGEDARVRAKLLSNRAQAENTMLALLEAYLGVEGYNCGSYCYDIITIASQ